MHVAYGHLELDASAILQGVPGVIDQLVIERLLQTVILGDQAPAAPLRGTCGL